MQYVIPFYNDTGWAQGAGNLSLYLAAIAANTLQPTGGSFTLTADVDFGANFGLKALFLKSETTNPASAGVVRLAKTDSIKWRNNANGADLTLSISGADVLQYESTRILLAGLGLIVNADVSASAAIAYSKLNLSASIVNADIASGAAIAYSKLALTGAILNADLAGSIAYSKLSLTGAILNADLAGSIAVNKLVALGTSKAVATDGSGLLTVSTTTAAELAFVAGVTSAIQTQLNAKQATLTAGQLPGAAGSTAPTAGNVGETNQADSASGQNFPATGTFGDGPSFSLTAGSWMVYAMIDGNLSGVANVTLMGFGMSTTTGNSSTGLTQGKTLFYQNPPASSQVSWSFAFGPIRIASPTTYYSKVTASFTGTTPQYFANIIAVRIN